MRELWLISIGLTLVTGSVMAAPATNRYVEGQVWEYKTRPRDKGSLLKIQKIEVLPEFSKTGPVYHVSIVGVRFDGLPLDGTLPHAPFSKTSLDKSVTRLSSSKIAFPAVDVGIAHWREARGGIFTITVAEAVNFAEQTMRKQMTTEPIGR
ncbi:hypothetical protein [Polymorphobacter sp.]|uniref:hypothetical protein n=1 Tax=Polymorphobacter sp. TaxID=1909290 RepID=UPI003F726105